MTKKQKRMRDAVAYLREYMDTYHQQPWYLDYSDDCLIDDVLYGLGAALDDKYKFADGFALFKQRLREKIK